MADTWSVEVRGENNLFVLQSPGMLVLEGDLGIDYGATLEKLQTPGVNSYRIRERSREFKDLRLQLMEDMTATASLYRNETIYQEMEGELVTLTVSLLTVRVRWSHVMVSQVQIVGRDGPLFGRGAQENSLHTLSSAWTFLRQQPGDVLE